MKASSVSPVIRQVTLCLMVDKVIALRSQRLSGYVQLANLESMNALVNKSDSGLETLSSHSASSLVFAGNFNGRFDPPKSSLYYFSIYISHYSYCTTARGLWLLAFRLDAGIFRTCRIFNSQIIDVFATSITRDSFRVKIIHFQNMQTQECTD